MCQGKTSEQVFLVLFSKREMERIWDLVQTLEKKKKKKKKKKNRESESYLWVSTMFAQAEKEIREKQQEDR